MQNVRPDEAQAGINMAGRNISNLRYADDTTHKAESEEELKSLLMKVERGEWKSWLKKQRYYFANKGLSSQSYIFFQ